MRSERHWFLSHLGVAALFALPLLCAALVAWLAWGVAVNGYPIASVILAISALFGAMGAGLLVRWA